MIRIIAACFSALFLYGCLSMGINFNNKTPKKPSVLPAFSGKDSLLGYNNALRSCFDVKHYDIDLDIDPNKKTISGKATSSFVLLQKTDSIQLDLHGLLHIDSILQDNLRLNFVRSLTAVKIRLRSEKPSQSVSVYYHGAPLVAKRPPWQGGFAWKKDENKKPFFGISCEGDGAHLWLPIKAWLGDEPDSVDMRFTVPSDIMAVSNGVLIGTEDKGNKKTYHWKTRYNINPYNITVYGGDYAVINAPYKCADGTQMTRNYYVLKKNQAKAEIHFRQVDTVLNVFEKVFGPYPWSKEGYKLVESPYEGMEHQTAIAYGHGYKNEKIVNGDYIVIHESAHEWWGNSVSVKDFSDLWIHEGLATYAEALYVENTKGREAYVEYMESLFIFIRNKKPIMGPTGVYYSDYRDGDIYSKGAAMLHTLRNHLADDSLFFKIIRTFYAEHAHGYASADDFVQLVNKMTGKDMNYFFKQYLYRRESPYLRWNIDYDFDLQKDQLIYKFDNVNEDFTMGVDVKQGNHKFRIYPTTKIQKYNLPLSIQLEGVEMNLKSSYLQNGFKDLPTVNVK